MPRAPLSLFVENLWYHQGLNSSHRMERLLPDGGIELIIDLTDTPKHVYSPIDLRPIQTYRGSWISGQQGRHIVIEAAQNSNMIGVRFRPGGFYPFFKAPVSEINDSVVDLSSIWGGFVSEIRDRLLEASSSCKRFDILEEMLFRRVMREMEPDPGLEFAIRQITRYEEGMLVKELAGRMGISHRQLIRRFDERVGLKPKALARVFRFNAVLRRLQDFQAGSMAGIAHDCGYCDQAHLIHEFQELTRMTPSRYVSQRSEYPNFVPIH